jgi:DNA-binding Lrp family transcriptional regulator
MVVGTESHELDSTDRRIVHELLANGRISVRELADRANISRAHTYVRLERLESTGVIEGFTVRIGHDKAGLKTSAFVALSIRQDSWRGIAQELLRLAYVDHFSLLGGDVDVLVLVRAPDNQALRHIVLEQLQSLQGVIATKTWLIFEESSGPGAEWL